MTTANLEDYEISLAANGSERMPVSGNIVRIKSATGDVVVETNNGDRVRMEAGDKIRLPKSYDYVKFTDKSGGANTIVAHMGEGDSESTAPPQSAVEVTKEPAPTSTDTIPKLVMPQNTMVEISAANVSKLGSWIQAASGNSEDIHIGTAPNTSNGIVLSPGGVIFWPGEMQVNGFTIGALQFVSVEDVIR